MPNTYHIYSNYSLINRLLMVRFMAHGSRLVAPGQNEIGARARGLGEPTPHFHRYCVFQKFQGHFKIANFRNFSLKMRKHNNSTSQFPFWKVKLQHFEILKFRSFKASRFKFSKFQNVGNQVPEFQNNVGTHTFQHLRFQIHHFPF